MYFTEEETEVQRGQGTWQSSHKKGGEFRACLRLQTCAYLVKSSVMLPGYVEVGEAFYIKK